MSQASDLQATRARDLKLALGIFLGALAVRVVYLVFKPPLLTADGCYYYAVARSLAGGRGFTINYVWHYLAGIPERLPTPSNDYWMPLSSVLQAGALHLGGPASLISAALPGILAGAALAAFVFWLTRELFGDTRAALLAAAMWAVSAHLVALSVSPDCFMVAALLTSLGLYAIYRARAGDIRWALAAGALAGFGYLTRTDGALVAATFVTLWAAANRRGAVNWRPLALFAAAFGVIAAPWWVRNCVVFGTPLGAPVGKTAFLATYNDIFRLDTSALNLKGYLALNQTVQTLMKVYVVWREVRLLAVICGLALPFAVWAIATHRRRAATPDGGGVADSSGCPRCARGCGTAAPFDKLRAGVGCDPGGAGEPLVLDDLRWPHPLFAVTPGGGARRFAPWLVYAGLVVFVTAAVFPYPALKGTFWHLAPGLCVFILAAGAAGIADAAQRLWRSQTALAKAVALALPAAALSLPLAWYAFTPSLSDVDRSPYRSAAGQIASLGEPVRVALTDDAWSLHHFSGLRCAQLPTDGAGAVLRVADALGANYLFVRERTVRSITEIASVRRCRRFQPVARWGEGGDAVYAYHLIPFAAAEKIAKSHNARGMALAAAGRYDAAVDAFEAAESYKPDFAPVIANIALACWQAGRREEAFLRAAQALAFDPANPTAKRILQDAGR